MQSWRALTVFIFILGAGPAIGGVLVGSTVAAIVVLQSHPMPTAPMKSDNIPSVIRFVGLVMVLAYPAGGMAAFVAALWLAVRSWHGRNVGYFEGMFAAAIGTLPNVVVFAALIGGAKSPLFGAVKPLATYAFLLVPALASVVICRWTLGLLGILPPGDASASATLASPNAPKS